MKKIHILFIASVFTCNILNASAPNEKDNIIDYGPLCEAIERNDIGAAENFLRENRGLNINHQDLYGETPLHKASESGHVELARLFLKSGADVNSKEVFGYTPLHLAACRGDEEVVKLLLECGARTDKKNEHGQTAAEVAQEEGYHEIAQLITSWNDDIKEPEGN